jgi:glycosyltransferase involved in cell wall biosynthesis
MRIARISEYVVPCPGGKEIHVDELTRGELRSGHDVELFFRFGAPGLASPAATRVRLPNRYTPSSRVLWTMAFARRARRLVAHRHRVAPFDVVHLHGDFVEARAGAMMRRTLGVGAALTVHAGLASRWAHRLARIAPELDAVICVGSNIAHDLEQLGAPADRLHVISSGIDVERIERAATPAADRGRSGILFVGTLEPMKGIDVLADAFARVRAARPGVELTVVGDGPDRRLLTDRDGIRILGRRDRDEVYRQMHRAQVLVVPSRDLAGKSEGMPTVVLEGLAAGVRIVASDAGSVRDALAPDVATLVPSGDAGELARALVSTLDTPDDAPGRERRRARAHERSWASTVKRVDDVLAAAARRPRREAIRR